jgi:hypothetical protein
VIFEILNKPLKQQKISNLNYYRLEYNEGEFFVTLIILKNKCSEQDRSRLFFLIILMKSSQNQLNQAMAEATTTTQH